MVAPLAVDWPDVLEASGEIAPWQEAIIGAEIAGVRLDKVLADVGDHVVKGQLLARYNEDALRAELAHLDALVAQAEANVEKADADAARADQLEASNAIAKQAALAYHTQAKVAQALLESAKAQRASQAVSLRHARIVAPDDGVISSRSATVGAVASPGVELFRMVRQGRLEWRAEVPSRDMSRLGPDVGVEVRLLDGTRIPGKLRVLSPGVDAQTRNGIAYVALPKHSGAAPGMYVNGRFVLATRKALTVPESAIVLRDGNSYVMQVDAEHHAHQIKVDCGRRRDGAIEILNPLEPGARLVKSGGAFLSEGDLVGVTTAEAQP
ncbi:MAG TPA: efflux RND transporter periplasmic adaptor subunit [Solimonas sp.]|nr:efflux RND transporter periplasmic adaptor subunit [Solimonas sp.]